MSIPHTFISFDFDYNHNEKILFAGQAKNPKTPFEIKDYSSKYSLPEKQWEDIIKLKVSKCHIMIVLIGKYTYKAIGVKKEIAFANEKNVPYFGIYVGGANRYTELPAGINRNRVIDWNWDNIASAINQVKKEGKNI